MKIGLPTRFSSRRRSNARGSNIVARRLFAERLENRRMLAVLFEQGANDPVRVLVPSLADYDDLGLDWIGSSEPFDDSSWEVVSGAPNGVGYDRGDGSYDSAIGLDVESQMYAQRRSFFSRAEFDVATPAAVDVLKLRLRYDDGFIAWLNGEEVARQNVSGAYPAWTALATASYEAPVEPVEIDISAFKSLLQTGANVLAIRTLNASIANDDALLQFTLTGESRTGPPQAVNDAASTLEGQPVTIDVLANDQEGSDPINPTTVAIATPPQHGIAVANSNGTITYTPSGIYNGPDQFTYTVRDDSATGQTTQQTLVARDAPVRVLVPLNDAIGTTWRGADEPFDDGSWTLGAFGVGYDDNPSGTDFWPYINLSVRSQMLNVNTSVYMRSQFEVVDPSDILALTLRMRYDDGFAAFLNGVRVAGDFDPEPLTYNSAAPNANRVDAVSATFRDFDITAFRSALRAGTNILAIHGLNIVLLSSDLLIQPELVAVVSDFGVESNPATVSVDVAGVDYPPVAVDDVFNTTEGQAVTVGGGTPVPPTLPPNFLYWDPAVGGNGHAYERVVQSLVWNDARHAAESRTFAGTQGYLATVTSAAERDFLAAFPGSVYHLGAFQDTLAPNYSEPSGGWKWITGEPWSYTNWASGEPNNSGANGASEDVLVGLTSYQWNDGQSNIAAQDYWVEYPISEPIHNDQLIATGDLWRYRDDGSNQGTAWRSTAFDDSSWSLGASQLGYGEGDEATTVGYGPNSSNKYITTYFRRSFQIDDPARVLALSLELLRDDGAVVYLNGTQVVLSNISANPTFTQTASGAPDDGQNWQIYPGINPALLVRGTNVIAVEVHQEAGTTSDLTFDLRLSAMRQFTPSVLLNDYDADGDTLTAMVQTPPAHGTLQFSPDGSFTYQPNVGFAGTDTFTYRAMDAALTSNLATATINIAHIAPTAAADVYSVDEDGALVVSAASGVLANDSDTQSHSLTATLVSGPAHGSLTLDANGAFSYTPAANYFGSDGFTYRASDGTLASQPAAVAIDVHSVNDVPVAVDDTYATALNQTLDSKPALPTYQATILASTPLAYWRLGDAGGTALDLVNGYNGTYLPGATVAQAGALANDQDTAVDFDGASGQMIVGYRPALDLRNNFTIETWVRPDSVSGIARFMGNGVSSGGFGFGLINGALRFTTYSHQDYDTQAVLTTGRWYHVAVVFDSSNDASFYVDGALFQKIDGGSTTGASTNSLFIGNFGGEPFHGKMDEVALYNRSLTAAELQQHYFVGRGIAAPEVVTLIPLESVWKYRDNIANGAAYPVDPQGDQWNQANYDDTAWSTGQAMLGYGGVDVATTRTTIGFGGNSGDKYRTALFRRTFEVAGADRALSLMLRFIADDGALIYVNGREVRRFNMSGALGDGTITTNAFASENADETVYQNVTISLASFRGLLVEGTNTVAVEVHQSTAASTDLGFDLSLTVSIAPNPASGGVIANDADIEGGPLSAEVVVQPSHGSIALAADGTFKYIPQSGFTGVDQFRYRISDSQAFSQPATVTIVVSPPSKAPEDLNADGLVNRADLAFLLRSYGKSTGALAIEGDLDGNGRINQLDIMKLQRALSPVAAPAAAAAVVAAARPTSNLRAVRASRASVTFAANRVDVAIRDLAGDSPLSVGAVRRSSRQ